MSNQRLFSTNIKISNITRRPSTNVIQQSPLFRGSKFNDTLLMNNARLNEHANSVYGRINKAHTSSTGFTALILLVLGILFFLFLCFIIGKCMGEEDARRSSKRTRKHRFSLALNGRRRTNDKNEVLHQKRVYEIQAEEGCYHTPPSIYDVSDDKLIVPSPAPIIVEKTSTNESDIPTPEVIISGETIDQNQTKPKNKAVEALMKRKATTADTPPALINVLKKKKAMLKEVENPNKVEIKQ
uniref:Uncharacterized protein n=1 Tax=Parastrongyloides trichosuri TaxID=131310 RepID=A0A0N4ZAK8_PARTI